MVGLGWMGWVGWVGMDGWMDGWMANRKYYFFLKVTCQLCSLQNSWTIDLTQYPGANRP